MSEVSDGGRSLDATAMANVHTATAATGAESKCRTLGATVGTDASVVLVRNALGLEAVVLALRNSGGRVGLALKTTGEDPLNDRVRLILIATLTTVFVIDMFAFDVSIATNVLTALAEVEIDGHNLQLVLRFWPGWDSYPCSGPHFLDHGHS